MLDFFAVLAQVLELLQRQGRVSYRALKMQFSLDDEQLEALKDELIEARRLAADERGRVLVWVGDTEARPEPPAQSVPASPPPPSSDAERRQLTVLFCDLVDSTSLAQQLDPEDYRAVVRAYQEAAVAAIQPFDGYVAQYLGDGLLMYFGYPQAHEDAAQRAVYAGLPIVDAMEPLNTCLEPQYGVRVTVRLGLHTGVVVVGTVGSGGRQEQLALGDTPNIAARLQGLAAPNTVVLSAATALLLHDAFILEDVGMQPLKGVTEPMAVYRVLGPTAPAADEVEPTPARPPFLVGRDEEIGLLLRRWEQSKEGLGQVVLVSGEAGIGKTALVEVLGAHAAHEGTTRVGFRSSPYHTHSALYPVIEHLRRVVRLDRHDSPEAALDKLELALQEARLPHEEVIPLLAALLALPLPEDRYATLTLTPQQQRQHTLDTLVAWLIAEAERCPVLAVYEDVHWADPSTLELLSTLVEQAPTTPMLHVLTFRSEFVPPWPARSHTTPITLNRLERPQVEALIRYLAGGKALPAVVVQHILTRTDGVPLFVEELTKMLLESGLLREEETHYVLTGPLASVPIPTTLHDALMARLDRLGAAKAVAQLGAVLGREFAYTVLRAMAPLDETTLRARLEQLVAAELLYQRGRPPRATYLFKHALIQDAAYTSLLKSTRQQVHQQMAQVLEAQFPEMVATQPELVARHYTEAGLTEQAIPYWQRAGQQALQRSAYAEAVAHLTKGLEVLNTLPDTPERTQRELDLQITLGPALMTLKGYGVPEVEHTYNRAYVLCQQLQLGKSPQFLRVLYGLRRVYTHRGALQKAQEMSEQCLSLAQHLQDFPMLTDAHYSLGITLLGRGDLISARGHLEQAILQSEHPGQRSLASAFGRTGADLGACSRILTAWTLWAHGYPEQARQRGHEAIVMAQERAHPFTVAYVLTYSLFVAQYQREVSTTRERAEETITLATEHGFQLWVARGMMLRGWALAMQEQPEEGIAQMRQGLETELVIGTASWRPYCLALLAEAYGNVGQAAEGLHIVIEALALAEQTGEQCHAAELLRLKGELLLQQTVPDGYQAEACFQQALAIAHRQQAKSWELRAAVSLSRLWQQQGKRAAAYELLAPIYGWFTEGFDTADLQEARALLDLLA